MDIPAVGSRVQFREGTPQHPKNKDITYVVSESPKGGPFSADEDGRIYVWLEDERDADKAPSRRRRRTGWVDALIAFDASPERP